MRGLFFIYGIIIYNKHTKGETMPLNYVNSTPLHEQLKKIIENRIIDGDYIDQIPSEQKLIDEFHVSRSTVRQAIESLVQNGMLRKVPGKGTFVNHTPVQDWLGNLSSTNEIIERMDMSPGAKLVGVTTMELSGHLKEIIQLDEVYRFKRIRYANKIPIGIENNYYPLHIGKKLKDYDLDKSAFYDLIEKDMGIPIKEADQIIKAGNINQEDAKLLEVDNGFGVLIAERKLVDHKNNFIEFEEAFYRSDMYEFKLTLSREN